MKRAASALIIPLFFVVRYLGLLNTYWALILPPLANPLGIFMARSFVAGIPDDLEASARLDGASDLTIYRRIVLPLIRPGLVVLGMFIFMLQYTSFLMDEPLSNLDAILRAEMRISLLDVHRRVGRATVYVTHDQTEAMTMADRVVVLHEGAVQQVGTPEEIYARPANSFVARFVGTPRMALLAGTVTDSREIALGDVTFRPDAPLAVAAGERVDVGIRPSGAHVTEAPRGPHLRGRVTRRDYLGGDCFLEVDISPEHAIVVRAEPEDTVNAGDVVAVEIRPGAAHLFGPSGERAGGLSLLGPP